MASLAPTDTRREQSDKLPIMQTRVVIVFAYVTLLISLSIYGFWSAFVPGDRAWLAWGQAGLLLVLWLVASVWSRLRPLRGFVLVSLIVNSLGSLVLPMVKSTHLWVTLFGAGTSYWQSNLGELLLKLAATGVMIGLLLAMGLRRQDFFLVKGQLDAPVGRIPWLAGTKKGATWILFGWGFAITTFLIIFTLLFVGNLSRLNLESVTKALPWLPAALLFAAMNAFHEEVVLRAAPLSQLVSVIGPRHALFMTILSFGLGHWAGAIPSGIIGVVLTSFFAYIMGKAMLETRGVGWPWICHFAADAAVFIFVALATVAVGMN